jgi:hypothetical protein
MRVWTISNFRRLTAAQNRATVLPIPKTDMSMEPEDDPVSDRRHHLTNAEHGMCVVIILPIA